MSAEGSLSGLKISTMRHCIRNTENLGFLELHNRLHNEPQETEFCSLDDGMAKKRPNKDHRKSPVTAMPFQEAESQREAKLFPFVLIWNRDNRGAAPFP